jgi:hypothetical protein
LKEGQGGGTYFLRVLRGLLFFNAFLLCHPEFGIRRIFQIFFFRRVKQRVLAARSGYSSPRLSFGFLSRLWIVSLVLPLPSLSLLLLTLVLLFPSLCLLSLALTFLLPLLSLLTRTFVLSLPSCFFVFSSSLPLVLPSLPLSLSISTLLLLLLLPSLPFSLPFPLPWALGPRNISPGLGKRKILNSRVFGPGSFFWFAVFRHGSFKN